MANIDHSPLIHSWNETLSIIAEIVEIPVALVTRVEEGLISIFCKNKSDDNPYTIGDSECLDGSGMYCEAVIKNKQTLNIPNALNDPDWNANPDLKLGMISYLGMPIMNVDDSPFGTICVLDNKERQHSRLTVKLINAIKQSFEAQLKQLASQHQQDELTNYKEVLELSAGMAHEINTPLGIAVTASSHLEDELNKLQPFLHQEQYSQSEVQQRVSVLSEATALLSRNLKVAAEKVTCLKQVAINEFDHDVKCCDLLDVVNDALVLSGAELKKSSVSYQVDVDDYQPAAITTRPSSIIQILFGLVQNSILHGLVNNDHKQIRIGLVTSSGTNHLHYFDNGVGIPLEERDKVFFPFFTTRRHLGSTGLGMCIIKRIVTQQLEGTISLVPSNVGVHFVISIPAVIHQ